MCVAVIRATAGVLIGEDHYLTIRPLVEDGEEAWGLEVAQSLVRGIDMDMDTSLPRQTIPSSLQAQTVHERRRAIAALLRRPLLTPGEKGLPISCSFADIRRGCGSGS